jgi:hypothetical protein
VGNLYDSNPGRRVVGPPIFGDHKTMTRSECLPDLDDLFGAADAHAAEAGDPDHAVGDLQEILRAAWRVMTPAQRTAPFAQRALGDLAELPEFGPLIGHLISRR